MMNNMFLAENIIWGDKTLFTSRDSAIRYVLKTYVVDGFNGVKRRIEEAILHGDRERATRALEVLQEELGNLAENGYINDFAFIYNVDVIDSE